MIVGWQASPSPLRMAGRLRLLSAALTGALPLPCPLVLISRLMSAPLLVARMPVWWLQRFTAAARLAASA